MKVFFFICQQITALQKRVVCKSETNVAWSINRPLKLRFRSRSRTGLLQSQQHKIFQSYSQVKVKGLSYGHSVSCYSLVCHFTRLCAISLASVSFRTVSWFLRTRHTPLFDWTRALFSACVQNKRILIRRANWHTACTPACHFTHCLLFSVSF